MPLEQALKDHVPGRLRPPPTDFSGGMNSSYSNWGTALAGLIVANVSGMSYDDYIEKNILEPVEITHTTSGEPLPPELAPHMSNGYEFA